MTNNKIQMTIEIQNQKLKTQNKSKIKNSKFKNFVFNF